MLQLLHRERQTNTEGIIFVAANEAAMLPLFRPRLLEWSRLLHESGDDPRRYVLRLVQVTNGGPMTMLGPMAASAMLRFGVDYLKGVA